MGHHTPSAMSSCVIVSADTLGTVNEGLAHERANEIQTVLRKISQSGGGVPHMSFKLPMPGGGGSQSVFACTYTLI